MKNMKKVLAIVLTALLCIPTTLSTVYAAETNGTYEAEDATIEGTYLVFDMNTFQFVEGSPIEQNANASGGKNVGYFTTVGNSITWTINADAAGTADLTFVLASCFNETAADYSSVTNKDLPLEGHLAITVNGTALDLTGKVLPGKGDATATWGCYDYYQDVTFSDVALNAGANTVKIEVAGIGSNPQVQEAANVDCLKVSNYTAGSAGDTGTTPPPSGDEGGSGTTPPPSGDEGGSGTTPPPSGDEGGSGTTPPPSGDEGGSGTTPPPTGDTGTTTPPATDGSVQVYEAENADVKADLSQMSWMGVTSAVEEKASASGGKSLGYFGAVGNKVTWTVESASGGDAKLTFVLASGAMDMQTYQNCDMKLDGMVKFTVNGTELTYSNVNLPAGNYENWQDVTFDATLKAGTNTIVLEVIDATYGVNIDCLKVSGGGATGGSTGGSTGGGSNGGATGGSGTLRIEAENADVVVDLSAMSWMGVTSAVESKDTASGGQSIGYFGAAGNKITWKFDASAAGKATLVINLASGAADMTTYQQAEMMLDGNVKITINGTALDVSGIKLEGGSANYDNWAPVTFEVDVAAGANEVVLEVLSATGPNVDYLEVSSSTLTFTTTQTGSGNNQGGTNQGGTNQGGSNQGGTNQGGNDQSGDTNQGGSDTNVVPNNKPAQQVKKDAMQMVKDAIIGIIVACFVALGLGAVVYLIVVKRLPEKEQAAITAAINAQKARKEAWKAGYAQITDSEEKEISRVKFALDEKAFKAAKLAEIEDMKYGEGVRAMKAMRLVDMGTPKVKYILPLLIVAAIIGGIIGANYVAAEDRLEYVDGTAGGKYTMVVEGYDWGPSVSKVVIQLDGKVSPKYLDKAKFEVEVSYQGWFGTTTGARTITKMYLSDEKGNAVEKKSEYITLELEVGPAIAESIPFYYDYTTGVNVWADPYAYTITLAQGAELVVAGDVYTTADIKTLAGKISPDADVFNSYSKEYEGITLNYAAYEPKELKNDKVKNALIIWLHGAGEGGTDTDITILGNRVTTLAKDPIQSYFDGNGAYVLAPQSPTMWMDSGEGAYTENGTSKYLASLKALIDAYVAENGDIDTNRILIGGCSNGGYMTMNMILTYPDYFAAAYPVCEAYADAWITDEMLGKIVNMPIWFTHSKDDPTVAPNDYTVATYNRLIAAGAKNVHFTYYDNVVDTSGLYKGADGNAYVYNGHYSWIYTLNNDCKLDFNGSPVTVDGKEVTIWEWLATQSK